MWFFSKKIDILAENIDTTLQLQSCKVKVNA